MDDLARHQAAGRKRSCQAGTDARISDRDYEGADSRLLRAAHWHPVHLPCLRMLVEENHISGFGRRCCAECIERLPAEAACTGDVEGHRAARPSASTNCPARAVAP